VAAAGRRGALGRRGSSLVELAAATATGEGAEVGGGASARRKAAKAGFSVKSVRRRPMLYFPVARARFGVAQREHDSAPT